MRKAPSQIKFRTLVPNTMSSIFLLGKKSRPVRNQALMLKLVTLSPNDQKLLMNFNAWALYMKPEPGFSGFLVPVAE